MTSDASDHAFKGWRFLRVSDTQYKIFDERDDEVCYVTGTLAKVRAEKIVECVNSYPAYLMLIDEVAELIKKGREEDQDDER